MKYTQKFIGKSIIIRSLFKKFHLCFPIKFRKGTIRLCWFCKINFKRGSVSKTNKIYGKVKMIKNQNNQFKHFHSFQLLSPEFCIMRCKKYAQIILFQL